METHKIKPDNAWIQTRSGRKFFPLKPTKNDIVIEDIAHALSQICRFTGHCKKFYSVAQHSVLVSYICDHKDALYGLIHDASEFALCDLPSPLKKSGHFENYKKIELTLQTMIYEKFNLNPIEPTSVKVADIKLLATEARDLMSPLNIDWAELCDPLPFKIEPLNPQEAKDLFMKRFFELTNAESEAYEHYLAYEYEK